MVEQSTVGFTTLFENQAKQAFAAGEGLSKEQVLLADVSAKIDYIQMGYQDAGSAAKALIGTVREFANVTPFRFAELNEAALRMRAFGFALDEVLKKNPETGKFEGGIVAVGNAVSALGGGADSFRRITYALGQMKQAGRVYQNDMMQLANAGIGGYKYIASALKKEITKDGSGSADQIKKGQEKLFASLESNAIETVRRLTTNGQISGEAASRAIIAGLEEDFGGGMEKQARTFAGAMSTVADTSQSLVADAFFPLFDAIRLTTVALGDFLQTESVRKGAAELALVIGKITAGLTYLGGVVKDVIIASFNDLTRAMSVATDKTKSLGLVGGNAFGGFIEGIVTVTELLKNDMIRQLLYAAGIIKLIFAFSGSNPLLTQIMLVVTAIGILRTAYDENLLGFATAVDDLGAAFSPLINEIQRDLIPLMAEVGAIFSQVIYGVLIAGFEAIEPAISLVIGAIKHLLRFIKYFETPVKVLTFALLGAFAGGKIVAGFTALSRFIQNLILKFDQLAISARAAATSMALAPGVVPAMYGGQAIKYAGAAGPSTRVGTFGPVGRMGSAAGAIGMAGMIGGSLAEAAGAPEWITSTVQNVSTALFGFSILKSIVPPGSFTSMITGLKTFLGAIKAYALVNYPMIAAGLASTKNALTSIPVIGTGLTSLGALFTRFATGLGGVVRFIMSIPGIMAILGATAATGGAGLFPLLDSNVPGSLTAPGGPLDLGGGYRDQTSAMRGEANKKGTSAGVSPETMKLLNSQVFSKLLPKDFFGNTEDTNKVYIKRMKELKAIQEKGGGVDSYGNALPTTKALADAMREYQWMVRKASDNAGRIAPQMDGATKSTKETDKAMKLLVNSQNEANANTEYLNWQLNKVKKQYQDAVALLQQLATQALTSMLNPDSMTNPYTGLEEAGLTMEEIMQMEQDMGFSTFENQSGIVRSFEEYRDILESIKPLTDADMVNGKISLKAVERRMSIEKERRKELERIRALAQAEYDIGLATLQQYDESIDPLQRAVNLRNAQKKYAEDIQGLQFGGIGNILDEAKASDEWTAATRATKKRLEEFKQGQAMILEEMTSMFNQYNEDIANILSNPNLSASQRKNQIEERLNKLYTDLETQFGVTRTMLQGQLEKNNAVIDGTLAVLGNPSLPDVNWGGNLMDKLQAGGFGVLEAYLAKKAVRLAQLTNAAFAAMDPSGGVALITRKNRDYMVKVFQNRLAKFNSGGGLGSARTQISKMIYAFSQLDGTSFDDVITQANKIDAALTKQGLASGGRARGRTPYLVGEKGPELVIPQRTGMVLNNSISSRLMGMLGGAGASGTAGNVTININNPVIRNENDIRKLAQEISRVQASQFRTEGGRL
jgi:hypothetical protein